jgi:hypothetical protein
MLCRHHHRWLHDTGGRIRLAADPPPRVTFELVSPEGVVTPLPSKNPLRRTG